MSVPSIVKGGYFDVLVEADPVGESGIFTKICGLTSKTLTHQVNTSDEAIPDCDDPEEVPWTVRTQTSQEKNISGTGLHNRAQAALIRSIYGKTLRYRFVEGEPGVDLVSQGYWEGPFLFNNWQEGATDFKGNVNSQFSFISDGVVDWTDTEAAALGTITVSPLTATASTQWTGTMTGRTPGSEVEASAPGATGVSVTGNTIKATWATTGSKTVTITETDPEATNSPKVTSITVVVS